MLAVLLKKRPSWLWLLLALGISFVWLHSMMPERTISPRFYSRSQVRLASSNHSNRMSFRLGHRLDSSFYYFAAQSIQHKKNPYQRVQGYLYPPFLAWLVHWLLPMHPHQYTWGMLLFLSLSSIGLLFCCVWIAKLQYTGLGLFSFFLLWSGPISSGVSLGNVQVGVAFFLAVIALFWTHFPIFSGLLLGIVIHTKPIPVFLLIGFCLLFLREKANNDLKKIIISTLVVCVAGLAVPHFGDYWTELVSGRFSLFKIHTTSNYSWMAWIYQTKTKVPLGVFFLLGLLVLLALFRKKSISLQHPEGNLHFFAILHCLFLILSPINWAHTFTFLLLPMAVALRFLQKEFPTTSKEQQQKGLLKGLFLLMIFVTWLSASAFSGSDWFNGWAMGIPILSYTFLAVFLFFSNTPSMESTQKEPTANPSFLSISCFLF